MHMFNKEKRKRIRRAEGDMGSSDFVTILTLEIKIL